MRDRVLIVKTGFSQQTSLVPTINVYANPPFTSLTKYQIHMVCKRVIPGIPLHGGMTVTFLSKSKIHVCIRVYHATHRTGQDGRRRLRSR